MARMYTLTLITVTVNGRPPHNIKDVQFMFIEDNVESKVEPQPLFQSLSMENSMHSWLFYALKCDSNTAKIRVLTPHIKVETMSIVAIYNVNPLRKKKSVTVPVEFTQLTEDGSRECLAFYGFADYNLIAKEITPPTISLVTEYHVDIKSICAIVL